MATKNPLRGIVNPNYFSSENGHWVYYQSLRTDGFYPALADAVDIRFEQNVKESSDLAMLSNYFYDLADGELTKERALLQEKFGRAITGEYGDKDFAKNLINGINECLGIKAIFERNLALI